MIGSGTRRTVAAVLCGVAARRALTASGAGEVMAVFRRSLYVASAEGCLACIGPRELGAGPLNLLCTVPAGFDCAAAGLRPGMPVQRTEEALTLGPALSIALDGAAPWRPPQPPALVPARMVAGLEALASVAAAPHPNPSPQGGRGSVDGGARFSLPPCGGGPGWGEPPPGFAPLVAPLARCRLDLVEAASRADPLLRLAWPGVVALAGWLGGPAEDAPPDAALELLGLGPGLTPSGDDLLGGILVALAALGRRERAARLAGLLLPAARRRTGAISAAHLACAAAGEGNAALHDLLGGVLRGATAEIGSAATALAALGHSSGWDMMAGAALACAVPPPA